MLFNSLEFLLFLPITFLLYWFVFKKSIQGQNILLLVASYIFYGWWDYRFLALILASTLVDYTIGLALKREGASRSKRKLLLFASIAFNLGLLFYFKYYNFFIESWVSAWESVGFEMDVKTLSIILPVGISFYTFQTLSYTIDVYKEKLDPTKNLVNFAVFVAFFPQLVAGPIERASNLLPQFFKKRMFNYKYAVIGMRLILIGLFKKVVIADNFSPYIDDIFTNYASYSGVVLIFGAVCFAIQIYCDFSGYSDIAIGTARLFGFELMLNFKHPYFSRNIGEFWRRWHISLSTWFRDYLYIPLGGSRGTKTNQIRNILIIFLVSGFWHGPIAENKILPSVRELMSMIFTFGMVTLAWVFFRAENIHHALTYLQTMFLKIGEFTFSSKLTLSKDIKPLLVIFSFFMILEWFSRDKIDFVQGWLQRYIVVRYVVYFVMVFLIIVNLKNSNNTFIYFQF
jgi:alginate O-acetyltransferase complex protein AlgI